MAAHEFSFWTWKGRVSRTTYSVVGIGFFALKYQIDRIVSGAVFDRTWSFTNYFAPDSTYGLMEMPEDDRAYFAKMLMISTPFIWIGAVMTIRRLRDAGLPLKLVMIYFFPVINWLLIALLMLYPSALGQVATETSPPKRSRLGDWIPESKLGSAFLAVVLNGLGGLALVWLSTEAMEFYGWGLFVGLPFCLGMTSALIYGYHQRRNVEEAMGVALVSIAIVAGLTFAVAMEGIICIAMAAPIWVIFGLFGGIVGYIIIQGAGPPSQARLIALPCIWLTMPAVSAVESYSVEQPPLFCVESTIVVNAPPEVVFENVVSFRELPPPDEWVFSTGVAYPLRAEIIGQGVGAERRCVFSTGTFVEPITEWDEPRSLKFDVASSPAPMQEWSFYTQIQPPHLHGFLNSRRGEFQLKRLPGNRTRLTGVTYYQHSMWPAAYWKLWSDSIIHTIHLRVLRHVKQLSEQRLAIR